MKKWLIIVLFTSTLFSAQETVYCIHGFMRTGKSMNVAAKALEEKGFRAKVFDYPSRERSIEEHGAVLAHHLKKTAVRNPAQPIHFYAHSMGGLVLRSALNHPDCPPEATYGKAVLLSTPSQGSQLAQTLHTFPPMRNLFGDKAGRELMREPNFEHLGPFPPTLSVLVIAGTSGFNPLLDGPNDGKVTIQETKLLTPHKHLTLPLYHSTMMHSPKAIKQALMFFKHS